MRIKQVIGTEVSVFSRINQRGTLLESTWRDGGRGVKGRSRVIIVCHRDAHIRCSERGKSALDFERVFHRNKKLERIRRDRVL